MTVKSRNIILILSVGLFFLIVMKFCIFPNIPNFIEKDFSNQEFRTKRDLAYNEYTNIFTDSIVKKMKLDEVRINKSKNPFLAFEYLNKYYITINKINLKKNISLEKIIHTENSFSSMSPDVAYSGYVSHSLKFLFSSLNDSISEEVFFRYDDNLLYKSKIGDSIIIYNLMIENISFRYSKNSPIDFMFLVQKENDWEKKLKKMNLNVAFYKKGKVVFIIIVQPNDKGLLISSEMIPNLFGIKDSLQLINFTP
jgi:hypothetical protein